MPQTVYPAGSWAVGPLPGSSLCAPAQYPQESVSRICRGSTGGKCMSSTPPSGSPGRRDAVEVRDVRVPCVQPVQHARADPERPAGPADVEVEEGSRRRADRPVLGQRILAKVADPEGRVRPGGKRLPRDPGGDHPFEGAGDSVFTGGQFVEPCARERGVQVHAELGQGPPEVRPGQADAAARVARLGRACIADEEQLALQLDTPDGECGVPASGRHGKEPHLGATGPRQRIHGLHRLARRRVHGLDRAAPLTARPRRSARASPSPACCAAPTRSRTARAARPWHR